MPNYSIFGNGVCTINVSLCTRARGNCVFTDTGVFWFTASVLNLNVYDVKLSNSRALQNYCLGNSIFNHLSMVQVKKKVTFNMEHLVYSVKLQYV